MRVIKLMAVAAVVGALALVGTASASADSTTCTTGGSIKLSPGLTTTPTVQNVTVKGTLAECASVESEATEGKFIAHFKTAEPISCATLASLEGVGAAAEENKIVLKLKPKAGGNPMGTFSVPIREGAGSPLSGTITSEGAASGNQRPDGRRHRRRGRSGPPASRPAASGQADRMCASGRNIKP